MKFRQAMCSQLPKMPLLTELENLLSDGLLQRWRSERSWGHEPVDVGQARLARHFLRGALARPPGCGQFWAVVRGYRKLNPRLLSGNPPGWRGLPEPKAMAVVRKATGNQLPKMALLTELEKMYNEGVYKDCAPSGAGGMGGSMLVRSVRRDIFCMVLWHALRGAGCFLAPFRGWSLRSPPGYWLATLRVGGACPNRRRWRCGRHSDNARAGNGQPTPEDAAPDGAWEFIIGWFAAKMALLEELGKWASGNRRFHHYSGADSPGKRENSRTAHSHPRFAMIGWSTAKAAEGRRTPGRYRVIG